MHCRELKTSRGLDNYEGLSFNGFHRHPTMIAAVHLLMLHSRDDAGGLPLQILNEKEGGWRRHAVFTCIKARPPVGTHALFRSSRPSAT